MRRVFCFVVFMNLCFCQKENESCEENSTKTTGLCRRVSACTIAREDFRIRGVNPTFCSPAPGEPVVCCRGANLTQTSTRPPPLLEAPPRIGDGLRTAKKKCEQYSRGVTQNIDYISLLPEPEVMSVSIAKCDYDNTALILGGKDADLGEFPHMAAIGWPLVAGGTAIKCGGSLISERFVLTAGHCLRVGRDPTVSSSQPNVVILGDHNVNPDVYDGASPLEVAILRSHPHPDYKPPVRYNDIGLIELAEAVPFSADIRPACLGTAESRKKKAVATGWGVVNIKTNVQSDILQKVTLDLMENAVCDPLLKKSKNRLWSGFVPSQMCAGVLTGGKDTCRGDSGGPLQVVSQENQCIFHVVGVTSFGGECAVSNQPAVYTRVAHYLDWIEAVVWPDG